MGARKPQKSEGPYCKGKHVNDAARLPCCAVGFAVTNFRQHEQAMSLCGGRTQLSVWSRRVSTGLDSPKAVLAF